MNKTRDGISGLQFESQTIEFEPKTTEMVFLLCDSGPRMFVAAELIPKEVF